MGVYLCGKAKCLKQINFSGMNLFKQDDSVPIDLEITDDSNLDSTITYLQYHTEIF